MRVRYFFIITFCLNALCASLICFKIWRINSRVSQAASSDRTTSRVFEVVIETGEHAALLAGFCFVWGSEPSLMQGVVVVICSGAVLRTPLLYHSNRRRGLERVLHLPGRGA